jgi:hypothetical protein
MSISSDEKKFCRDCAYLGQSGMVLGSRWDMSLRGVGHTIGEPTVLSIVFCNQKSPNFNDKNLDNNSCEQFLRKKAGMTLTQQLEEQKQEKKKLAKEKRNKRKPIPQSKKNKALLRSKGNCEKCKNSLMNVTPNFHHKDGNPQNNKLSNIQVLCPNCHSNTKTFKKPH